MRVLYIDIDSLRPDHLGAYGYHRDTSPVIDALAAEGLRFENLYVTDAPCLPSRTALWSGRHGYRTGVVGHGGTASEPFREGPSRGFKGQFGETSWMAALRGAGLFTATISSFGERHGAWHWYAGFNEIINPGLEGLERADLVVPLAIDWLERKGRRDNWFLHVNLWDPHTPYRTPEDFPNPFGNEPLPAWLTEERFAALADGYGPHSPREPYGFGRDTIHLDYPMAAVPIDSLSAARTWFDGYDTGVRHADLWVGRLLEALNTLGIYDDTVIVIGADHGENLGELNVWADHHTADAITCRVPLIIRWPGTVTPGVARGLHHHFDWAATLIELAGGSVPGNWDGRSFAAEIRAGTAPAGRDFLVTSQGAWAVQRGVRFKDGGHAWLALFTYHDGYKDLPPVLLFDLAADPHQLDNLSAARPEVIDRAGRLLAGWLAEMQRTSPSDTDPLATVLREGGPHHTRGELTAYLDRLRATERGHHADALAARHPGEV